MSKTNHVQQTIDSMREQMEGKDLSFLKNTPFTEDNNERRGFLIVFEGPDGVGKTTIAKKTTEILKECEIPASVVRTPGGTPLGEKLRMVVKYADYPICDLSEAYLFQAQLAQCVKDVIIPKLDKGEVVVCDRLIFSTMAYQGMGRGLSLEWLDSLQEKALQGIWPDKVFMLHPKEVLKKSPDQCDRMENAGEGFQKRVGTFYSTVHNYGNVSEYLWPISVSKDVDFATNQVFNGLMDLLEGFKELKGDTNE